MATLQTKSRSAQEIISWFTEIVEDLSHGRIVRLRIAKFDSAAEADFMITTVVMKGKTGQKAKLTFGSYGDGRFRVMRAQADAYFGWELKWSNDGEHGGMKDASRLFEKMLNELPLSMSFAEVAQMPRPLRWLYLRRN